MNRKTLISLIIAAAAIGGVAWVVDRQTRSAASATAEPGETFFPELAAKVNDIGSIAIRSGAAEFTVTRTESGWGLEERGGYPVNVEHVKTTVVGLSELRPLEKKTAKPELYSKIGVQDPGETPPADGSGVQPLSVTLKDSQGTVVLSAILGNTKWGAKPQVFVRKVGDSQSWLAEGRAEIPREPLAWVERQILNLGRDRVKSATVTHADGATLTVSKAAKTDTNFTVEGVPEGRELTSQFAGDALGGVLSFLSIDDVTPASSLEGEGVAPGSTTVVRTFDGLVVTVASFLKDGKTWCRVSAGVDDALLPRPSEGDTEEAKKAVEAQAEAVRKEAADLATQLAPWAFAFPEFKTNTFNTKLDGLLKPVSTEDSQPPAADAPPGTLSPEDSILVAPPK